MNDARTIVITGTASGLGRATVERFSTAGWNVVATVRKPADLDTFAGRANIKTLLLEVTDEKAVRAFGPLAIEQFGRVDVLVNNAGYYQMGPLETSTMEQIRAPKGFQLKPRCLGLMAGMELRTDADLPATDECLKVIKEMLRRGFLLLPEGEFSNVISFTPPLTMTRRQLATAMNALAECLLGSATSTSVRRREPA